MLSNHANVFIGRDPFHLKYKHTTTELMVFYFCSTRLKAQREFEVWLGWSIVLNR